MEVLLDAVMARNYATHGSVATLKSPTYTVILRAER
jgi:hypothetical protein